MTTITNNDLFKKWDVIEVASERNWYVITHISNNPAGCYGMTLKRVPKLKLFQVPVIWFYKLKNWWLAI